MYPYQHIHALAPDCLPALQLIDAVSLDKNLSVLLVQLLRLFFILCPKHLIFFLQCLQLIHLLFHPKISSCWVIWTYLLLLPYKISLTFLLYYTQWSLSNTL